MRPLLRGLSMLRPHWPAVLLGLLAVPAGAYVAVQVPQVAKQAIDLLAGGGAGGDTAGALGTACLLLVALAAGEALLGWIARMTLVRSSRAVEQELKQRLFTHLQELPATWFDRGRTGDLLSRFTQDVELVRFVLGPILLYLGRALILLPLGLSAMYVMSPLVTAAVGGAFLLLATAMALLSPRIQARSKAVQEAIAAISQHAAEDFSGIRVLQNFARARTQIATMGRLCDEYFGHSLRLVRFRALQNLFVHAAGDLVFFGVLLLGGLEIVAGRMSPGDLFAFLLLLGLMTFPLLVAGWTLTMLHQALAAARRIEEVFTTQPEPATGEQPVLRGELRVTQLTFTYPGSTAPALTGVSFTLPAGAKLGIVGPIGAGKSTLLALLLRLYDPPPGTMFVDGHDLLGIAPRQLRELFALAPQDPFLFSDTVRGNVEFGRYDEAPMLPEAADAPVLAAVATAALEPDLTALPQGLESVVGERGVTLSGGQKQRVSLARALASGRTTLLLDDTLSAIDHGTEAAILAGLQRRGTRSMIVVAHRLSAVRDADWILFLDGGRVREQGPPDQLLARDGAFAAAWRLQQEAQALESDGAAG